MARRYEYECDKCGTIVDPGKRCRPDGWISVQVDTRGGLTGRYELCNKCSQLFTQFLNPNPSEP